MMRGWLKSFGHGMPCFAVDRKFAVALEVTLLGT